MLGVLNKGVGHKPGVSAWDKIQKFWCQVFEETFFWVILIFIFLVILILLLFLLVKSK